MSCFRYMKINVGSGISGYSYQSSPVLRIQPCINTKKKRISMIKCTVICKLIHNWVIKVNLKHFDTGTCLKKGVKLSMRTDLPQQDRHLHTERQFALGIFFRGCSNTSTSSKQNTNYSAWPSKQPYLRKTTEQMRYSLLLHKNNYVWG